MILVGVMLPNVLVLSRCPDVNVHTERGGGDNKLSSGTAGIPADVRCQPNGKLWPARPTNGHEVDTAIYQIFRR